MGSVVVARETVAAPAQAQPVAERSYHGPVQGRTPWADEFDVDNNELPAVIAERGGAETRTTPLDKTVDQPSRRPARTNFRDPVDGMRKKQTGDDGKDSDGVAQARRVCFCFNYLCGKCDSAKASSCACGCPLLVHIDNLPPKSCFQMLARGRCKE